MFADSHRTSTESAFTLIELVTATALLGLVLAGIAVLTRSTADRLVGIEKAGNEMLRDELISYLQQRMDVMVVLTDWDFTHVSYLDRLGRSRSLNISAFNRQTDGASDSSAVGNLVWLTIQPTVERAFGNDVAQQAMCSQMRTCLLTICIRSGSMADTTLLRRVVPERRR